VGATRANDLDRRRTDANDRDEVLRACELVSTGPESVWVPMDQKVDVGSPDESPRDLTLVLTTALDDPG
jgi:hypothetical protein